MQQASGSGSQPPFAHHPQHHEDKDEDEDEDDDQDEDDPHLSD